MNGQDPVTFILNSGADLTGFRQAVRSLTLCETRPELITWSTRAAPDLFGNQPAGRIGAAGKPIILSRAVAQLIEMVVRHSDPEKYARLYDLVWRMKKPKDPELRLLEAERDPLVRQLRQMETDVQRDIDRMQASLRFRQVSDPASNASEGDRFIAWFEPEHFIVEAMAPFFVDRFTSLDWTILTPKGSMWWDRRELAVGPPAIRSDTPEAEASRIGWRAYHESEFNPARTHATALRQRAPQKSWRNLPETQAIPQLIHSAASRVEEMIEREAAMPAKHNPDKAVAAMAGQAPKSLAELNRIIKASDPFVEGSDRAVLGEGPMHPGIAFVGEQPGDKEDELGRPFVGPAGKLFDQALEDAAIDRHKAYITNAVKHFKFVQRGKRRLHQTPTAGEIRHYRWWLERELDFVQPKLVVALGATAAHALAGKAVPVGANRGPIQWGERSGYLTVHPSWLLRIPDKDDRAREFRAFVTDLKRIRDLVA